MVQPLYLGFSSVNRPGIITILSNIDLIKADLMNSLLIPIRSVVGCPRYGSIIPLLPFELDSPVGGIIDVLVKNVTQQIKNDPRVLLQAINVDNQSSNHTVILTARLLFVEYNIVDNLSLNFSTGNRMQSVDNLQGA